MMRKDRSVCQGASCKKPGAQGYPLTVEHLTAFAETFADLADAEIMKGAWE